MCSRMVVVAPASPTSKHGFKTTPLKNSSNVTLRVNLGTVNRFEAMNYCTGENPKGCN